MLNFCFESSEESSNRPTLVLVLHAVENAASSLGEGVLSVMSHFHVELDTFQVSLDTLLSKL